ncbi:MAG: hypothetical protein ACTHJW_22155 [Streptosporangiaceae bacterium]
MNDIAKIAQLSAISDAQADLLIGKSSRRDLADRITAGPPSPGGRTRGFRASGNWNRRLLIGVPAAVCLAVAALVVNSLGGSGGAISPAKAALVFTRHGHYINVIVRNPLADPAKYRAEFKARGLDITLRFVPASPSIVGTVVYFDGSPAIKVITAQGQCFTGGGGSACPVGLRVPVNYRGSANLVFGRAARTGERYESTVSATSRGESLYGLRINGKHVSVVLRMIARRHITAAVFHVTTRRGTGKLLPGSRIPGHWWVYGADPWAPGRVMLWVGPTRKEVQSGGPQPASPAPTASSQPGSPVASASAGARAPDPSRSTGRG